MKEIKQIELFTNTMQKRNWRKHLNLKLLVLLFLLSIVPQMSYANDADKEFLLGDLKVTVSLEKILQNGNRLKICLPNEPTKLVAETVPIKGRTINILLLENNIRPNYEAYGIVYALNPDIKDLGKINIDQINLPKVLGGELLTHLFEYNFKISLAMDKKLKEALNEENNTLNLLIKRLSESTKFENQVTKADILNRFKSASTSLVEINRAIEKGIGPPFPTTSLERLLSEIRLLQSDINSALAIKSKSIGQAELEQIAAVSKDLEIKAGILVETAGAGPPRRYPQTKIIVRTFRNGTEVSGYRVYYTAEVDRRKPERADVFTKLSSPTDGLMEIAEWCFFAATEGDSGRRSLSGEPICKMLDQETITIDLRILH